MQEGACREQSEGTELRFEDLPFASVPGQSKLFLDYLSDPVSLRKYYPSAVEKISELPARSSEVLENHRVDREAMCGILMDQNAAFGGGERSAANILKLKDADCVAVLTGQQAGLLTGPLYTIYKALTAVRISEELNKQGTKAVPIFWIATEDHDFEEVSNAFAVDAGGQLSEALFEVPETERGRPVGKIAFDGSIALTVSEWLASLAPSDFRSGIESLLNSAYASDANYGLAFGKLLARLFEKYGLVIFDPLDERAKRLSTPIAKNAIENSDAVLASLQARSELLEADGYHAQVMIGDDHFPLFWINDDGKRVPIRNVGNGRFRISGNRSDTSSHELLTAAESDPSRFSAGVILRPVVQDYLFPTICYVGGGAEIAYFAQNSEVYRVLQRPVTPIVHRQSLTIVEPKQARAMEKYGLKFEDIFKGLEALLPDIVERVIDPKTPHVFAKVEEKINLELNRLDQQLSEIDPTLAANLETRRRKIIYHIAALRTKFERVRIQKDEIANRRLRSLFATLYPDGGLQERTLNFVHFANPYGIQFVDWVYDSVDVNNKDHRILYLR